MNQRIRWAIDDIQNGIARIEEDGQRFIAVPISALPSGARVGYVLSVAVTETSVSITLDEVATAAALQKSAATTAATMAESRRTDPGGNVAL